MLQSATSFSEKISNLIHSLIISEYGADVLNEISSPIPEPTKKDFEGDFSITTFGLAKYLKKNPEDIAKRLGELSVTHQEIKNYSVVKGFLNLSLADEFILQFFENTPEVGIQKAESVIDEKNAVFVEYSSPNTNKPLHLGHVRNNLLGYSIAQIIQASGTPVIKGQIINDRGIHICKSMYAWQKIGSHETPESAGIKGDAFVGKYYVAFDKMHKEDLASNPNQEKLNEKDPDSQPLLEARKYLQRWENQDPEIWDLWKKMNSWVYKGFEQTYSRLGVEFDVIQYESDTYILGKDIIKKGLEEGVFYQKDDQSVWVDLTGEGLDHKLLLRSDGTSVYITQDLGTAWERFQKYSLSGMVYTVGNEQDYHFQVLFAILKKLGFPWADRLKHLSYGMVELPDGKMKSREGTVVDADELMEEMYLTAKSITEELGKLENNGLSEEEKSDTYEKIGMAALKYYILKIDPQKKILFDPKKSIDFQGNTGPFILYTYARIQSLLKKAGAINTENIDVSNIAIIKKEERELIFLLDDIPAKIQNAANSLSPAILANHVYEITKSFNSFYQSSSILQAENPTLRTLRIQLAKRCGDSIGYMLQLLGIQTVDVM